jgi:hypothetical protein
MTVIVVLWVMETYSLVGGQKIFRETRCLQLEGGFHSCKWRQYAASKSRYHPPDTIIQKTTMTAEHFRSNIPGLENTLRHSFIRKRRPET